MDELILAQDRFIRNPDGVPVACQLCGPNKLATRRRSFTLWDRDLCDTCEEHVTRLVPAGIGRDEDFYGEGSWVAIDERSDAVRDNDSLLATCPPEVPE